eukprot:TRINITY_DN198_c0_g2_i1.p2 TRINITY_DN198_c0_g2~~TRINITY_DN198_c0_g2_i1.p2  ORF type:complete len:707 (-),score=144.62 TRINITY_DN198_c0_g2_i1:425-2545(-)
MQQEILPQTFKIKVKEESLTNSMQQQEEEEQEQGGDNVVGEERSPCHSTGGEVSSRGEEGGGKSNEREYPKSEYRGVCWNKKNNRWQAAINIQSSYLYLGSYKYEEEMKAAEAFDVAAFLIRGRDRSKLNFPDKIDSIVNSKDPNLDSAKQKVQSFLSNRQDPKEMKKKEEDVVRREMVVWEDERICGGRDLLSDRYVNMYSQLHDPSDQQFLMDIHNKPDRHEDEDYSLTIQERVNFSPDNYNEMPWCFHYLRDNNTYQFQKAYKIYQENKVVFEGLLLLDTKLRQFATLIFDPDLQHPGIFQLPRSTFQRAYTFLQRVLYRLSILKLQHVDYMRREYLHNQNAAARYNSNEQYLDSNRYQEFQQVQRYQQQQLLEYQQQQQLHQQQQDQYLHQQPAELYPGHRQMLYDQQQRNYPTMQQRGMSQYQDTVLRAGGAHLSDEHMAYAARGFSDSGGFDVGFMEAVANRGRRGGYGQQYEGYVGYDSSLPYMGVSSPVAVGGQQQQQQQEQQQVLDLQEIAQQYGFLAAAQQMPQSSDEYGRGMRDAAPKTPIQLEPVYKEEQQNKEELVGNFAKGMSIGEDMLPSLEIPDSSEVARLQAGASGLPSNIFGSMALGTGGGGGDKSGEQKAEEASKQQIEQQVGKLSADLNNILTTSRSQNMSFDLGYPPSAAAAATDYDGRERDMSIELMQNNYSYDDVNRILASEN